MYDALTPLFDNVSTGDLNRYFKSEKLGTKGQGPLKREPVPRKGVRIMRDRFNVPHIYGKTNDDVTWGAGWALAHDRELLLEQARYNARVAVVDAPGADGHRPDRRPQDLRCRAPRPSARCRRRSTSCRRYGKPRPPPAARHRRLRQGHQRLLHGKTKASYKPWTRRDVIALNAVKSELFGEGGGAEVQAAQLLDGLQATLGADARALGLERPAPAPGPRDHRSRSPATSPTRRCPKSRSGNVVIDNGSFQPIAGAGRATPARAAERELRRQASNVLMVAGKRSRSGHPLFVGGPQIGYFYPGLTLEMDLHGPGWTARGATSAPFPGYILIGRREDFVWTLTSAGADIVDNYVETLCDGSDTKYLYKGKCRAMTPFNAGTHRRPGRHLQPDRARAGDRLRDGRRHGAWRSRASARATCSTASTCCCSSA